MSRTYGSYMIQPTKDELRFNIVKLRSERDAARAESKGYQRDLLQAQEQLDEAARLLGNQIIRASVADRKRRLLTEA